LLVALLVVSSFKPLRSFVEFPSKVPHTNNNNSSSNNSRREEEKKQFQTRIKMFWGKESRRNAVGARVMSTIESPSVNVQQIEASTVV